MSPKQSSAGKVLAASFPVAERTKRFERQNKLPIVIAFPRFGRGLRGGWVRHRVRRVHIWPSHTSVEWICGNMGHRPEFWNEDTMGSCCLKACDNCERRFERWAKQGWVELPAERHA